MIRAAVCFIVVISVLGSAGGQDTLPVTRAEAHKLAIENNPRLTASRFTAEAAAEVPAEVSSSFQPTFTANLTGVGADSGSRIAAGSLNNPVIYNRLGSGLT